jgi:hypothetical protein
MQIASLISNDSFMSGLNISIPTDDLVDHLNDFVDFWIYNDGEFYPMEIHAIWSSYYEVNLTQVLHPKGFCFTFNAPKASEVFRLEKYYRNQSVLH